MTAVPGEAQATARRSVLVVGANGFLGGFIVAALQRRGHRVIRGVRAPRPGDPDERECDLTRMLAPGDWDRVLDDVDVVVNAAGILRPTRGQSFEDVHERGPLALAQACVAYGIQGFVQVSALGVAEDGEFIHSKHRFDARLLALPLRAVVLRPSVVYAMAGSYGGTSLLRALAAMPGAHWLPGEGRWPLQPLATEDLAELVARAVESEAAGLYEVGGPASLSLRDYQQQWRRWLRIPGRAAIAVPEALVTAQVWLWERLGHGPVGETMWRMLRRGNVTAADAGQRLRAAFGFTPRALADVLAAHPSQVQDRWHAQLYFLAPLLRIAVIVLWTISALAGLSTPAGDIERLAGDSGLQAFAPVLLARGGGVLDGLLALWLATGWKPRAALLLMMASVIAYSLVLGSVSPALWLDPLGGLAKNLVILPALAVLWVLVDRR
ncbi:SDR family oxidoreductase [Lysobacter terrae]